MAEEVKEKKSSVWSDIIKPLVFLVIFTILSWLVIATMREALRRAGGSEYGTSDEDMLQSLMEQFEGKKTRIVKDGPLKIDTINWEKTGVGGLTKEMETIVQRVFLTRLMDKELFNSSGLTHTKGVILYGPPGCGKTRIARVLGEIVGGHEIIVINGPEIFDCLVGNSEQKIRRIFEPAKRNPDKLYIIIFDEFDAIAGTRSQTHSSGGVESRVVNQLLTEIDGFSQTNNCVLFGLTNRLDMIDKALLRPGRFEVHIEIPLPDANGRYQILQIHSKRLRDSQMIAHNVDWRVLAEMTDGYSGADIEAIIRMTFSQKIHGSVDNNNITDSIGKIKSSDVVLTFEDFEKSIKGFKKTTKTGGNQQNKQTKFDFDSFYEMAKAQVTSSKPFEQPKVADVD